MEQLYLVAEAGDARFAMPAEAVESVVTASEIIPAPRAEPMVAGIAALRSKVITVIDTMAAIEERPVSVDRGQSLVVVEIDDFLYGLAVDEVHDVYEHREAPRKLGAAFDAGWRRVSTGVIEFDGAAIVVVDPAMLIAGPRPLAA